MGFFEWSALIIGAGLIASGFRTIHWCPVLIRRDARPLAIFLLFLIILLLVPPVNGSEDWVEYWRSPRGNIFSYNNVSITHGTKDAVQVWEREVFSDEGRERQIRLMRKMELSPEGYDKISHALILYEIDCKKKMFQTLSFTHYGTDGKVLLTSSSDNPDWRYIVTDSVMDTLREKVCK